MIQENTRRLNNINNNRMGMDIIKNHHQIIIIIIRVGFKINRIKLKLINKDGIKTKDSRWLMRFKIKLAIIELLKNISR